MTCGITDAERALLNSGRDRVKQLNALHHEGRRVAKELQTLVGRRCKKLGKEYEITSVSYGYNGHVTARGYKIVKNGKRGQVARWEIGTLTAEEFEQ